MSLVACIISCMSQLCVLCQMIVDLGCSCFSAYCIVISKPQQQQLQKTTTTTMESFFKRALKTHLFSTTRRHWDVFVILSPDINIQAYLLTYCYYCCCCYCYYALDVLRALILCRCRRFINHLLTYLLTTRTAVTVAFGDGLCTHLAVSACGAVWALSLIGMEWLLLQIHMDVFSVSVAKSILFHWWFTWWGLVTSEFRDGQHYQTSDFQWSPAALRCQWLPLHSYRLEARPTSK